MLVKCQVLGVRGVTENMNGYVTVTVTTFPGLLQLTDGEHPDPLGNADQVDVTWIADPVIPGYARLLTYACTSDGAAGHAMAAPVHAEPRTRA